jgi:signal transduction histidine kinase
MPQPVPAEMLFAAIDEREVALARVSRLLHDDVSQVLSAVGLQLDAMRMDFRGVAPDVDSRTAEIQHLLEQAIAHLRDISNELNPSIVERAGLHYALERLTGQATKNFAGSLRLHSEAAIHVPTPLAKAFYKIAEWALERARSRSSSTIDVHLKRARGNFVLEVIDDGPPDNQGADAPCLARLLIDYYASQSHISWMVNSSPEKGNVVRASHPIENPAAVLEGGIR